MKIYCNNREILEITETDRLLLEHDLLNVDDEIERRLKYIIEHKAQQCYLRLKKEWDEKFTADSSISSVPSKREDYVRFVKSHKDYKNRQEREAASALEALR